MDKYDIGNKLGSGGFATVYLFARLLFHSADVDLHRVKGRRKADGKAVAIKKIECDNFDDANQALTEGKMLLELDHQHVIKYYDFFLHQDRTGPGGRNKMFVVLVMQYAPNGDLFSKLERAHKEQRHIPEETIRRWLYQLCLALEYIGKKRIIHRDIKLANILLDGDVLKLADFGIAKVMHGKMAQTIVGGTPCYMAPELLYKEKYDMKSDIWSLGCMIWELSCRCLLSQTKGVLGAQVLKDPSKLREMWQKMEQAGRSQELTHAVKKMLAPEAVDRISVKDILDSSLFRRRGADKDDAAAAAAALQTLALTRAQAETAAEQPLRQRDGGGSVDASRGGGSERPSYEYGQAARQPGGVSLANGGRRPQSSRHDSGPPRPIANASNDAEVDALCSEADKYQQSRDYERAERCFRKALAMNPGHTRSLCNYAYMLHVGRRDYAKAEELYRRALQTEPNRTATLCNYAYLLHSDKRLSEAKQIFHRARDTNPDHPWVRKNQHLFT